MKKMLRLMICLFAVSLLLPVVLNAEGPGQIPLCDPDGRGCPPKPRGTLAIVIMVAQAIGLP
jgi:hypothetical protein